MYIDPKGVKTVLVTLAFVVCGGVSLAMHGGQTNAQGLDKDAKMSISSNTFFVEKVSHEEAKEAKRPLICGKLGVELAQILEKEGEAAFNAAVIQSFREMSEKEAEELLVPVYRKFLSHMSDETIEAIMVWVGVLPTCLDCFADRLSAEMINNVVSKIISSCPLHAVEMIKLLATDDRTKNKITTEGINKPFGVRSLLSRRGGAVKKRYNIVQELLSHDVTREKVLQASINRCVEDMNTYSSGVIE